MNADEYMMEKMSSLNSGLRPGDKVFLLPPRSQEGIFIGNGRDGGYSVAVVATRNFHLLAEFADLPADERNAVFNREYAGDVWRAHLGITFPWKYEIACQRLIDKAKAECEKTMTLFQNMEAIMSPPIQAEELTRRP